MGLFNSEDRAAVNGLKAEIAELRLHLHALENADQLTSQIDDLKIKKRNLEIDIAKVSEESARMIRETEHKVGLERQRMQQESEHAKQQAVLEVRQANLDAERDQFAKEMDFMRERMEKENGYVRDLLTQILGRLPDVNVNLRGDIHGQKTLEAADE